jgi:predicted ester cyclase
MSTAPATSNKSTLRRLCDAMNTGDPELISETIDELVLPDALIHTPLPIQATGPQLLKEVFTRLHRAFPDLHITIEDLIEQGEKVVSRNTVTGTHQGDYMGIPPTGKTVTYNEIFILRVVDGRIAESWGIVDVAGVGAAAPELAAGVRGGTTDHERQPKELRPVAFAIAYRMLGSVSEAEDVVQEALPAGASGTGGRRADRIARRVRGHGDHPAGDQRAALRARPYASALRTGASVSARILSPSSRRAPDERLGDEPTRSTA